MNKKANKENKEEREDEEEKEYDENGGEEECENEYRP